MPIPDKKLRAFTRPGDLERVYNALAGSADAWKTASPVERSAFLKMVSPIFASYEVLHTVVAQDVADDLITQNLFAGPLGFQTSPLGLPGIGVPGGRVKDFWRTPFNVEKVSLALDYMKGWLFWPRDIELTFFNNLGAVVVMNVRIIRATCFDSGLLPMPGSGGAFPFQYGIIADTSNSNSVMRLKFTQHPASARSTATNPSAVHWLRDAPITPNTALVFHDWTNLVAGYFVRFTMSGEWRFNPYFIDSGDKLNS